MTRKTDNTMARRTDNTMARRTYNTMAKVKTTKRDRQYNGRKNHKEGQTIQWPK